ncbi:hypothetical protein H4V95_003601 [Arthrobacter sp. CAN_C5]|nr:hypothetical protein [Arthrobacter sp. CAN_C5]
MPLLTLGIPTTATAAIILVAFQRYQIQPGPLLFEVEGALVWALIASLYVGNLMLLVLNLPLVGLWVKILQIPRPYLYAGILVFAALGAFSINFTPVDVWILLIIGLLGFFMRRYGYPIAPMVVGLILGPIFEDQLRRSMAISQGDPSALITSPIAAVIYATLALIFAGQLGVVVSFQDLRQGLEGLLGTVAVCTKHDDVAVGGPEPHQGQDARCVHRVLCRFAVQGNGDLQGKLTRRLGEDGCGAGVQANPACDCGFAF